MNWYLWAHERQRHDNGATYYEHIGTKWWVEIHRLDDPIVSIMLTEDPDGSYWGWQDTGEESKPPVMIWPSKAQFDVCFTYGPDLEVKKSKGHIVRLSAKPWLHGENLK